MKKLHLLSTLLLSLTFLCFSEKAAAQCSNNQYQMTLNVILNTNTGIPIITCDKPITTFNRVDFVLTGTGASTVNIIGGDSQTFTGSGLKTIVLNDVVNGGTKNFNFTIRNLNSTNPYQAPDAVWNISGSYTPTCSGCTPDVGGGLAKAYIKYANADKKLRKILVFVEGIDFQRDSITDPNNNCQAIRYGDFGWDVFFMGHKVDTSWDFLRLMPSTRLAIQQKGYDIVLVDFRNGADYMQANGEILITLLRRLRAARVADDNGVLHAMTVLGASMGGQVAKYALSKMEDENPADYCVNNYIAFDSPHKGANIPIALQSMLFLLERVGRDTRWTNSMLRPAARQLLQHHLANTTQVNRTNWNKDIVNSPNTLSIPDGFSHRTDWLNTLNKYGTYPTKTRSTAIACGNETAVPLTWKNDPDNKMFGLTLFSNAGKLLNPFGYVGEVHLFAAATSKTVAGIGYVNALNPPYASFNNFNSYACCGGNGGGNILFAGAIPGERGFKHMPISYHSLVIRTNTGVTLENWDAAPGCIRTDFADVEDTFKKEFPVGNKEEIDVIMAKNVVNFTFMPTVSALDINWDMTDNNMYSKNIFDAKILKNKLTPFEDYYAPTAANLQHVQITNEMSNKVIQWLGENERNLLPSLSSTYNYGFAKRLIPSLSIINGGILRVNDLARISYQTTTDPIAANTEWETYLYDCGGSTVNIENGGKFIIGSDSDNKKGIVHIPEGSVLNNISGTLKLQKNSEIIIEKGGILNLKGGISDLYQASKITVQKDAILNITGGTLTLRDASKIIVQNGGKVIITGGASSLLATSQFVVEQGGIVEIKTDATIAITEQSTFDVRGKATFEDRSNTTISDKATMQMTGEVRFNLGNLTMRDESLIQANAQSLLVFNGEMDIQMNNLATIDVLHKATLRFDGSLLSPVRFKGGNDPKESTPIKIHTCKWIINAPMFVSGSAFFQMFGDPSISSLSNMGFNLKGDGKRLNSPFKMLELLEGVIFSPTRSNIQHGKVIYQNNAGLTYYGPSFFTDVYFKGNTNGTGVSAVSNTGTISDPSTLNIASCLFEDVDVCVNVSKDILGDINIINTTAKRFKVLGFDFEASVTIKISDSHFISSEKVADVNYANSHYAPALRVSNMSSRDSILVSNTVIESTVNWQYYPAWVGNGFDPNKDYSHKDANPTYPPQSDRMEKFEDSYLVGVFGVPNFQLNNASEVKGGYIGILTDMGEAEVGSNCPGVTNVSISCSSVHHNYTGIAMLNIKEPTPNCGNNVAYGGIVLNSATIDDNVFGIYGRNIFLDANLTSTRMPNSFGIKDGPGHGHYMCISYSNTASPQGFFGVGAMIARNNYWKSGAPQPNINYLLNGHTILAAPAALSAGECAEIQLQDTDPDIVMAIATDEEKAFVTFNGRTKPILPLYWKGISQYLNRDIEGAIATLSEITAIPLYIIQESENPYLRSYYTMAWTIAPGPAINDIGGQKVANIKNTNAMFIFPNPAEAYFKLVLPSGRYDVQLSDVLGRVAKQIQVADYEEISIANIQSGLYQVTVRKQGEQAVFQTGKIVIKE